MSEVVAFQRAPLRRNSRRALRMALVAQIIEALEMHGGSAHCDIVIAHILRERRLSDPDAARLLRKQVLQVFADHCETVEAAPESEPMFRRVYGAESRRWGFGKAFHEQRRLGVVDLEQRVV